MTAVISCLNLSKAYPLGSREASEVFRQHLFGTSGGNFAESFWALNDISFEVGKGEAVAIVGRNGSGKSTLLQILTGVMQPTSGSATINGRVSALLELGSGFDPEYTGRQNVYVNGAILGLDRHEIDQRLEDIIAFADIGRFIDEPVRVYSSGMFMRLAFSVAVHTDPEILIVDEALSVGDARFASKCMRRIRSLREGGTTLLFVSHDVGAVRALCERAIWLDAGRIQLEGPVLDVTAKYSEYLFADETNESEEVAPPVLDSPANASRDDEVLDAAWDPAGALNYWGSHLGLITGFSLQPASGRSGVIDFGESVRVSVVLDLPGSLKRDGLSVAISIKDINGSDLMVHATALEAGVDFTKVEGRVVVEFLFENLLTSGKYFFVVAVEDRSGASIHYYEYVEGIEYFSVLADSMRFGIFNVPASVSLREMRNG